MLSYSRLKQGRTDEALPVSIKIKPIGAGLPLTKLVCQDFTPDEALLIRILKILGTFFVKKKGSIKQPLTSDHSRNRNYL